jgi:Fe-S cluster biogenesis protein NfuA
MRIIGCPLSAKPALSKVEGAERGLGVRFPPAPCYDEAVNDLYDRVDKALDEIRPYIHSHAGDVNIVDVSDKGAVKLQMVGTCHGCPMSMLTLRLGIERILMEKVDGVTSVEAIRPDDLDFGDYEADENAAS